MMMEDGAGVTARKRDLWWEWCCWWKPTSMRKEAFSYTQFLRLLSMSDTPPAWVEDLFLLAEVTRRDCWCWHHVCICDTSFCHCQRKTWALSAFHRPGHDCGLRNGAVPQLGAEAWGRQVRNVYSVVRSLAPEYRAYIQTQHGNIWMLMPGFTAIALSRGYYQAV